MTHQIALVVFLGAGFASAAEPVDFAKDIQPIFATHCYSCHGPKKQESNFRLDVKTIAIGGGDLGETSVVPGMSAKSFLLNAVSDPKADVVMPPKGPRLSANQIDLIRRWIDEGANWPDELAGTATIETDHWSFQPVVRPVLPSDQGGWSQNAIDRFVLAKLRKLNLQPSKPADPITLIRRLYLDMLGIPPSPDEVQEFLSDAQPTAYERLVDRVLASPRYGERWARHWLDVVRFAESHGFETNRERPNAWPFRDYVINSLNDDKPYDQFVKEQIAGDAFGAGVATGYLVAGSYDVVKSQDKNLTMMQRQDELADMVNTTGTTFLGLTIGCARCHNHKFDPILQKDFYAMQAIFAGVNHADRPVDSSEDTQRKIKLAQVEKQMATLRAELEKHLRPPVKHDHNVDVFKPIEAKYVRFTITKCSAGEPCIDELEIFTADNNVNVALATTGAKTSSGGDFQNNQHPLHKIQFINDGKYGNERSWIAAASTGWVQIELAKQATINRVEWARDRNKRYRDRLAIGYKIEVATEPDKWQVVAHSGERLASHKSQEVDAKLADVPAPLRESVKRSIKQLAELESQKQQLSKPARVIYAGTFSQPPPTHRLYRGEFNQKREVVAPDTLTVTKNSLNLDVNAPEKSRRIALAHWITNQSNPLTARVIVNRLWQYHFGTGIVTTSSDFGANGGQPTQPELLDWLASELVVPRSASGIPESAWLLKRIHRLILTSATYRQSSNPRADGLAIDGDSRLLWRFPPRRLEAEVIRDSILTASGTIDLRMGGVGFNGLEVQMENVRHFFPKTKFGPADWRRMIYMTKWRQEQDATFGAFDCPDGSQTIPQRAISTSPLQAFNLLNSSFVLQQSEIFAQRLRRETTDEKEQVRRAFALVFARLPSADEQTASIALVREHGLTIFCRAMLNTNEFLFLP